MAAYQYPSVPRGSQTQPQIQSEQAQVNDNRFSFVTTPAEATGRSWKRQSEVPPLPVLPGYLSPNPEPEQYSQPPPIPQAQPQYIQERGQSYYTSESAQGYLQSRSRGQSYYQSQSAGHHAPQEPSEPVPSYTQDVKPKLQMEIPQALSAAATIDSDDQHTSLTSPNAHQYVDVGPDANPLSPTTPTKPQYRSSTTNLPIISPAGIDFPASSYVPQGHPQRGGTWQYAFCSCSLPSICVPSLLCPCITYGKTQYRLTLRSDKKDPTNILGYHPVNGSCLAFGFLCGINSILAAIQHTRIRKAYGMDGEAGNVATDCLKGLCCCCCVVAQDEKEVKWREEACRKTGHEHARGGKEGYVASGGMVFQQSPS